MFRKLGLLAAIGMMPLGYAAAQMGGPPQAEPFIPDVDVESWIYQFPAKWQPYSAETETKVTTTLFPYGQRPERFRESLSFDTFSSTMGVTVASQLYDLKVHGASSQCTDNVADLMQSAPENGYSTSLWTLNCTMANGDTVFTMGKATLGGEKLYLATKTWTSVPGEGELQEWRGYFRNVYVCDPRTGVNPCQPPGRPEGPPRRQS